jgi:hypothetical protein
MVTYVAKCQWNHLSEMILKVGSEADHCYNLV